MGALGHYFGHFEVPVAPKWSQVMKIRAQGYHSGRKRSPKWSQSDHFGIHLEPKWSHKVPKEVPGEVPEAKSRYSENDEKPMCF